MVKSQEASAVIKGEGHSRKERQGTDMDTPVVPLAASVHQFCCHEKDTNFRFAFMIKC
jgi:hypothetical protein